MAFCRVLFPLLVLSVVSCTVEEAKVPVFIWGNLPTTSLKSNPLYTVSTDEFGDILKDELSEAPLTVVFIDKTLSVEDFSLKNEVGKTSFPNLHANLRKAIYLPSVNNPLIALNKAADPLLTDKIELTEIGLTKEIEPESIGKGRFIFIYLEDARESESRAELLERHDQFMQETLTGMPEDVKLVAIYTARNPSWTIPVSHFRYRREARASNTTTLYALDGLRLAVEDIVLNIGNNSTPLSGLTGSSSEIYSTNMSTTMQFDTTSITLNFGLTDGYWFFTSIHLNMPLVAEVLDPRDEVFALAEFSYRCQQTIVFVSDNKTSGQSYNLTFTDLKIQPFFKTTNASEPFGDSFNCVGYFTAPIWACLFVVFILLTIMFYGIMMMMDIRTMDRFDDPKGKTITINAGE